MPIHHRALADGLGQVLLPDALDRKYPNENEELLMLIRITYRNNCHGSPQEPVVADFSGHSLRYLAASYPAAIKLFAAYADQSNY